MAYLLVWIFLGLFYFLSQIPRIGNVIGVVLAFGPFLLILTALLLCVLNLGLLFFVTPAVALQSKAKLKLAGAIFHRLQKNVFANFITFFIATLPIILVGGLLFLAAYLTNVNYQIAKQAISVALQWFFIMLPFCAFLSPAVRNLSSASLRAELP